jgi:hypothetical protein
MSVVYQADVINANDEVIDTLECGGDDGSLPPIEMGPDSAHEELERAAYETYGSKVRIGKVHVKGATG